MYTRLNHGIHSNVAAFLSYVDLLGCAASFLLLGLLPMYKVVSFLAAMEIIAKQFLGAFSGYTPEEEDSKEYDSPIILASAVADTLKSRTDTLLKKTKTAVSSKQIVMRAEYAYCPNLTIIDTPRFVLKEIKDEPGSTPVIMKSIEPFEGQ